MWCQQPLMLFQINITGCRLNGFITLVEIYALVTGVDINFFIKWPMGQ